MATDLIRYDLIYQDAMRGIVRKVLADAAREGLPGDHHFVISFRTQAPGVRLSAKMRKQYPATMTIVLQHQFWGLSVGDQAFEVGLSFHGEAEVVQIPFEAIVGFFDPAVDFGLKIMLESEIESESDGKAVALKSLEPETKSAPVAEMSKPRGSGSEPAIIAPSRMFEDQPDSKAVSEKEKKPEPAVSGEAKVVSLETFRKKP
jgi:uncharacterized protein